MAVRYVDFGRQLGHVFPRTRTGESWLQPVRQHRGNLQAHLIGDGGVYVGSGEVEWTASFLVSGEGGVEVGGSGQELYLFTLGMAGGVSVGGDATPVGFFGSGEGGVEVGGDGSAIGILVPLVAISGGAELGGDANDTAILSVIPSGLGGVLVGGDAVDFLRFGEVEPEGGVEAGGDATSIGVVLPSGDGGIEVGGDGVALKILVPLVAISGGASVGGDANDAAVLSVIPSGLGGVLVGGDAVDFFQSGEHRAEGGVELGGDAAAIGIVLPSGEGGIEVGGSGSAIKVLVPLVAISGGSSLGGDANDASVLSVIPSGLGGVQTGGDAIDFLQSGVHEADGGASVGGDGMVPSSVLVIVPEGGVWIGGYAGQIAGQLNGVTFIIGSSGYRGATNQIEIMHAIRNRLVDSGVFLANQAYIAMDGKLNETPPHDQYAAVFPGRKTVQQPAFTGAGLHGDLQTEVFEVRIYHRLALDQSGRATSWTVDRTRGGYRPARLAAAKLHGHDLADASGTVIVAEPTRIQNIGDPVPERAGYGYIPIYVEVMYTSDLLDDSD